MRSLPVVGCAEHDGYGAIGHGNSASRFYITWRTGPDVVAPFERRARGGRTRPVELRFGTASTTWSCRAAR
jgi:predicted oxidoreductase